MPLVSRELGAAVLREISTDECSLFGDHGPDRWDSLRFLSWARTPSDTGPVKKNEAEALASACWPALEETRAQRVESPNGPSRAGSVNHQ